MKQSDDNSPREWVITEGQAVAGALTVFTALSFLFAWLQSF